MSMQLSVIRVIFVCLGLVPFLLACDTAEVKKEKGNMSLAKTNPEFCISRPPIDAQVPAKTETATFALG